MKYRYAVLFLFLSALFTICGCHKQSNGPYVSSVIVDGSLGTGNYTGYTGMYISFSFGTGGNGQLVVNNANWEFGDGSVKNTTVYSVLHEYSSPGTYAVTLTINGKTVTANMTILPSPAAYSLVDNVAGNRHWKGTVSGWCSELTGVYSQVTAVDTTVPLLASGGIVTFGGQTVYVSSLDTLNKVFAFKYGSTSGAMMQYYYTADSIIYNDNWGATPGQYENLSLQSP